MAPKKKPGKNGFYQFMLEFRATTKQKFKNPHELSVAAGRRWQGMTREDREKYERIARLQRPNPTGEKCTNDGRSIVDIQKEEHQKQYFMDRMKKDINDYIKQLSTMDSLTKQLFYIIHINNLIHHSTTNRYYLCEIGIAAFTLEDGILPERIFHRHIKPGKLPIGYYGDAKRHSDETHQMLSVVYDIDNPEDTNPEIFSDMIDFLKITSRSDSLPLLFAHSKRMKFTQHVMDTWKTDFKFNRTLKVYSLEYMFYTLRNTCASRAVWPSETFSIQQIERDPYSHNYDITCDYHSTICHSLHCSKAVVVRTVFVICENCCPDLQIKFKLGYHLPNKAKVNEKDVDGFAIPEIKPKIEETYYSPFGDEDENFDTASMASDRTIEWQMDFKEDLNGIKMEPDNFSDTASMRSCSSRMSVKSELSTCSTICYQDDEF